MVDLTGINLDEEQTAKITALFDSEIGGLKNKVDELIGEKRNVQASSTEKDQIIDDARKAAAKAHEETLIASGKTDELKAFYEEQLATTTAELTATAKTAKDALTSRDRGDVMGKVMGLVHDDHKWNSEIVDVLFIPIWREEGHHMIDRQRFIYGYMEEVKEGDQEIH